MLRSAEPHVGAQSQQLDNHLHGENHGEDHVEDVHDGGEELRLLVMLDEKKRQRSEAALYFWTLRRRVARSDTCTASVSVFPRISTNMTYSN